jgi:hypothetical protein
MPIVGPFNSGVASGSSGSATANADTPIVITGLITGAYVRYNDSPPAGTTDVTIKTKGTNAPSYNILVLTNAATDGLFIPRKQAVDPTGAAITGANEVIPVDDYLNIAIAQANANDSVDVWLYVE